MPRSGLAAGLALLASVGVTALPIWGSAAPVEAAEPFAVTATTAGSELDLTWSSGGDRELALLDEHTGRMFGLPADGERVAPLPSGGSQFLSIYSIQGSALEHLASIRAQQPPAGSMLPRVVAVTDASHTVLTWSSAANIDSWTVDTGTATYASANGQLSLPIGLADTARVELSAASTDALHPDLISILDLRPAEQPLLDAPLTDGEPVTTLSTSSLKRTDIKYDNFIPMQYVNAPDTGTGFDCERGDGSDYWFGGDNRSWAYDSDAFRTRGVEYYVWDTQTFGSNALVNPTRRYVRNSAGGYYFDSQRTADKSGILISKTLTQSTEFRGNIVHRVGNPYCNAVNSIDYRLENTVYRSGSYSMSGVHDKMPNHHIYLKFHYTDGTVGYRDIIRHTLTSPLCLNDVYASYACPQTEWQAAG